ncbi:riboflavin synthase [secondary endosymbiont of Ctenarytaina eucalypti]|uniref:Riboflavin synthase n=1 Tax=secondary endosymbiont of Ctenarytaina eucalypti TaxID=1199245 RepID=J3YRH5_9ENTR|nr:riboflavin synthase [secondary endosymbiont of Ctenarytaina eucalypti]AFP84658.1 riboflavin synthase alpha chain [secondary endosymbiont of Ctenarytaina eucalypti]
MFTGIVQGTAPIIAIEAKKNLCTHYVRLPTSLLLNLDIGASIAHNGCCLTVTNIADDVVSFDLMQVTLQLTNLGAIKVGDEVNLERPASLKTEIGGHMMSGHIIGTAELSKIVTSENNRQIWFSLPNRALMKYILHKGYIGVDGISLTVSEVADDRFCVHLIPETLRRTTLGKKRLGASVNIEIDSQTQAIIDTVERVLSARHRA